MNKLKIRLSDKKTLDLDIPVLKRRLSVFYFLDFLQYISILVGIVFSVYALFNDEFDNIDLFTLVMKLTAIITAVQAVKVILGGLRYFPESRFDLFSLLLLIGLISTLLIKQFFDLVANEGMFPSSYYWQMTIWGILTLLLFSYVFDAFSRNKTWLAFTGIAALICFEIGMFIEILISGDIYSDAAILMIAMAPIAGMPVFFIKNWKARLGIAVNALFLVVLGFLNVDADFLFFFSASYVILSLFILGADKFSLNDFKDLFSKLWNREFKKLDTDKVFVLSFPILGAVFGLIGVVLAIVKDSSGMLWLGLDENRDVLKAVEDLNTFLIGDAFKYGNVTDISNLFMSYGLLGILLIGLLITMVLYSQVKLFFLWGGKSAEKNKGIFFFGLSSFVSSLFLVVTSIFTNIPIISLVWSLGLVGATAAAYAIIDRKVLQHDFLKFKKGSFLGQYYKWLRYLLIIGVVVAVIYFSIKFDSIFLEE